MRENFFTVAAAVVAVPAAAAAVVVYSATWNVRVHFSLTHMRSCLVRIYFFSIPIYCFLIVTNTSNINKQT